jgi:NADH-quinone oxidoreductase subunit N
MIALIIISALGILAMLSEIFKFRGLLQPITLTGVAAAFACNFVEWNNPVDLPYFGNMIAFDHTALAFSNVILFTAFVWFILSHNYFKSGAHMVDHYALTLFALVGALMLTAFTNMTTLFLGVEILSIPLYVLAASKKNDLRSNEAGFKYLIMGSFASGFLLFGVALIYGATGSFDLPVISARIAADAAIPGFFYAGMILLLVAMCFKASAAPFHFWAPDVYEGSPTLITAFMSTVVKAAVFAAFLRLFVFTFGMIEGPWTTILAIIIALSLVISNFSAAVQTSVKRLLAYSSIGHAAFMLMAVLAGGMESIGTLVYYSAAYSVGSIASFGVLYILTTSQNETISAFNGLGKRNPLLAFCMTVAMLSLAGIPVTAGFFAKYSVFVMMIDTPYTWLLILAVITSAIGAYYYLKIVIAMYMGQPEETAPLSVSKTSIAIILFCTLLALVLGIVPGVVAGLF